jgi:hypothetical protein
LRKEYEYPLAVFMFLLDLDEAKLASGLRSTFEGGVAEDCAPNVGFGEF